MNRLDDTPVEELQQRMIEAVLSTGIRNPLANAITYALPDEWLNALITTIKTGPVSVEQMRQLIHSTVSEGMRYAREEHDRR